MAYKNTNADLIQNDLTAYVITLNKRKNVTLGIATDSGNQANATIRLDASFGGGIWKNSISLSDPSTTIGGAYLTTLIGPDQSATTQDRVFGAEKIRIVRTDANGGACKVIVDERLS